jgi:hypothetical protein
MCGTGTLACALFCDNSCGTPPGSPANAFFCIYCCGAAFGCSLVASNAAVQHLQTKDETIISTFVSAATKEFVTLCLSYERRFPKINPLDRSAQKARNSLAPGVSPAVTQRSEDTNTLPVSISLADATKKSLRRVKVIRYRDALRL